MMRPPLYPPKPVRAWAGTPLHDRLMRDPSWIVEPKIDGDRCLIFVQPTGVELWSRHGRRFDRPWLAGLREQVSSYRLPVGTVLDGELVAGPSEQKLHLYDYASGEGSLDVRRQRLLKACPAFTEDVCVVPWLQPDTAYETALSEGHEGIVWKRRDSRYEWQPNTTSQVPTWIKMKP